MKKIILSLLVLFTITIQSQTINVKGLGAGFSSTSAFTPSAILDVRSPDFNKGSMFAPKLTTTQRDAITSPATFLTIANTTTGQYEFYNGTTWVAFGGGSTPTLQEVTDVGYETTNPMTFNYSGYKIEINEGSGGFPSLNINDIGGENAIYSGYLSQNSASGTTIVSANYISTANSTNVLGSTIEAGKVSSFDDSTQSVSVTPNTIEILNSNGFKTTLVATTPTADRTITFPDSDVTIGGGSISLAGEAYLSLAGSVLTANPIDLSGTNVTGSLPNTSVSGLGTLATQNGTFTDKLDKNTSITAATKTKITYDAKGLVTSGADATTADIADSTNKRYITDAQLALIPTRKSNILVLVGGQSNSGTDPATGRVPYADMPSYLTATPTNIQWVNIVSSVYTLQSWTPDPAQQWGWLNQTLFTLSQEYSNVIWSKRGLGGTTILPERLGNYPRANFKAQTLYAIAQADAAWGAGTYDVVMLWNQGETNGATLADAQVYEAALKEWFLEARSSTVNIPIIYNKMGRLQVQAFPYIISDIQPAQLNTSLYDFRNKLITGESNTAWELQDLLSDTSHYNKAGAITLGANFTDRIFETLERTKTNNSPPVLVSATIPAGGATIVLTYNKTLNPAVAPFWRDFVLNSTKKVVSTAISGSTCVLTVSEPFYGTGSQLLTYYRSSNFEGAIMDEFGNKAKSFTDVTVTNSSGITTPTYTNKYTSNFATVDGWTGDANCTPTGAETIGGVTNCLKVLLNGDTTPLIYHTAVLTGTSGHSYRVKMSIYVPLAYWGNGSSVNSISFKSPGAQIHNVYTELRGALLADKWINLEYTWTQSNTDTQIRFEGQGVMGTAFYVKNIVVDKIN